MNRIETKIIIMVTNRLASAKESDAKTEMIEELSENLYQRYLELTEQGTPEDAALAKAMESLGDVEELLAYLREAGGAQTEEVRAEEKQVGESQAEDMKAEEPRTEAEKDAKPEEAQTETTKDAKPEEPRTETDAQGKGAAQEWSFEFKKDLENSIDTIVNFALDTAKVAQDIALDTAKAATETAKATVVYAKDVAKDVSEQWKERYPDGVFSQYDESKGQKVNCTAVAVTDAIHSLDIRLMNGDVSLYVVDKDDTYIEVNGDTQEVETILRDDGVLSIVQENTASASFFFLRGMRHCDIVVTLPRKVWNRISISTMNGDVLVEPELECRELHVSTASGDIQMSQLVCDNVTCHSGSGDVKVKELAGNLYAATKSGDVWVRGRLGRSELHSISGDVELYGICGEVMTSSTSGDVQVDLENVPQTVEASSVSGDCTIRVPRGDGMHISYRTVSGDFSTNLPLTTNMTKKRGETTLGDGAGTRISVSSTSGDVAVYTK